MIWIDYALIIIIVLSALYGFYRGIIREILSLVGWVFSYWVALKYSHNLTGLFEGLISNAGLLYGITFAAILIITLIACTIVTYVVGRFIKFSGMGFVDRGIGAGFGVVRGVVIVTAMVFFSNMTPLAGRPEWTQSSLIGPFNDLAMWATDFRSDVTDRKLPSIEDR